MFDAALNERPPDGSMGLLQVAPLCPRESQQDEQDDDAANPQVALQPGRDRQHPVNQYRLHFLTTA